MAVKRYRVLRVLEYEGTEEFIRTSLSKRTVKGVHTASGVNSPILNIIREAFVGDILGFVEVDDDGQVIS